MIQIMLLSSVVYFSTHKKLYELIFMKFPPDTIEYKMIRNLPLLNFLLMSWITKIHIKYIFIHFAIR